MKLSGMASGPAGIKIGHVENTPKGNREPSSESADIRKKKEDQIRNDLENAITMK